MGGARKLCLWFLANCEVQLCSALAAMSILGVVVVCPVMLDPAIDTLVSSFDDGQCQTIYSQTLRGLSNCSWTSCREGCTAEIYTCHHILVVYVKTSQLISSKVIGGNINETLRNSSSKSHSPLIWNIPYQNYSYIYARDMNLSAISDSLVEVMEIEGYKDGSFGVGSLLPNPQGCIYPSDFLCVDFLKFYGNLTSSSFPCFISSSNKTIVVVTVDKLGALRNIFYCFIPVGIAFGVFTYLFYQVGLIGNKRKLKRSRRREEEDLEESEAISSSPSKSNLSVLGRASVDKNGQVINNGAPPGIKKKLRKKFLPRRDNSSKRKRKGKLFAKKNLLAVKQQLRTPGRTPSISIQSDDGLDGFTNSRQNDHRQSVQFL